MPSALKNRIVRLLVCVVAVLMMRSSVGASSPATAPAHSAATQPSSPRLAALQAWLATPRLSRPILTGQAFARAPLTGEESQAARKMLWDDHVAFVRDTRAGEWKDEAITIGSNTLRLKSRHFGDKPAGGWNLFISMHGGGGAAAAVNDQQWENQIQLYQPKDSLYIAPRAPTDNWNLWHESHVDELFDRLIQDAIVLGDVDPDHVYLMGYSAGGDGVYQLAPRMADRFAAASMMAGHPNDASPLGLRDLPFAIHVGALDNGFDRNKVAEQWGHLLDDLQQHDPSGYTHVVSLHPGRAHWMNLEDRVAVDWMQKFTRNPIPEKIVWRQSSTTHDRFYWLAAPAGQAAGGQLVIASREKQTITIDKAEGLHALSVLLNDSMLKLDEPVTVTFNGKVLFRGKVTRTIQSLQATLQQRGDPDLVFDAQVDVHWE